jgi:hypothetical protein
MTHQPPVPSLQQIAAGCSLLKVIVLCLELVVHFRSWADVPAWLLLLWCIFVIISSMLNGTWFSLLAEQKMPTCFM